MPQLYTRDGTIDAEIVAAIFRGEDYSPDLIDYAAVRSVVDVGSHIGAFTAFVKEISPDAEIVGIEPDADNAIIFLMNTRGMSHVCLMTGRVAYAWQESVMVRDKRNTGGVAFVPTTFPGLDSLPDCYEVQPGTPYAIVTLEQAMGNRREVDVLKIDCEGGEFDILLNAPLETLARFRWIVGEYHALSGDITAIARRLRGLFAERRIVQADETTGVFCFERYA